MNEIEIAQPHGYMEDINGRVCLKFGNWEPGNHRVPEYVDNVTYVDGPSDHDVEIHEDYRDDQS